VQRNMRALVKMAPGVGNVAIREVPVRAPGPDEILIRIKYCGVCGTDLHIYADEFPNDPPVIMGHEYCGTIEQVGVDAADTWSIGDRVVGELHTGACGECELCLAGKPHICDHKLALGSRYDGAFAEYLTLPAWLAHRIPEGIPWEIAGITEPFAITAHCLVERGGIEGASSVLISGSGTMGLLATIWSSRLGIRDIIVAGTDQDVPMRFPLALAMGATRVVNVQQESLDKAVAEVVGTRGVDAWVECSGSPAAIGSGVRLTKKTGTCVLIGLMAPEAISVPWNQLLYKELDVFGCFSSPPSSWQKALAAERDEADKLSQLVQVRPFDEWELAFDQLRHGQVVKTLLDLEA